MPVLPSFITYKPGRRARAVIKAPFTLLRGESSHSQTTHPVIPEVIDIKDERYSLDFDGGRPTSDENNILDDVFQQTRLSNASSASPPVKLEIDLPPEALTDWFAANFPRSENQTDEKEEETRNSIKLTRSGVDGMVLDSPGFLSGDRVILGQDGSEDLAKTSEAIIADLELMDASHFVSEFHSKHSDSPLTYSKKPSPSPLSIPNDLSRTDQGQRKQPRDSITMLNLSFLDTPASSALSGTTLARALFSNAFSLSSDYRLSGHRSDAGLTRTDSTVLPRDDAYRDQFSIAPDAPPMPADAETLYEAPKKPRAERRKQLKRRSSTGTLHIKTTDLHGTRPNSFVVSPSSEFDILRSPDPWTAGAISHAFPTSPKFSTTPATPLGGIESLEAQKFSPHGLPAMREAPRLPDPQFPGPQSPSILSALASLPFDDPAEQGIDDVLGYYSLPPVPLLAGASYRPVVSPIREETSSDLSRPSPYKHDSKRIPPFGARSQISGSSRARSESLQFPRGPLDTQPISRQNLPPFTEGLPMNEAARSGSPASTPESLRAGQRSYTTSVSPLPSADKSSTDESLASHRHDSWDYFSQPLTTESLTGPFQHAGTSDVPFVPTTPTAAQIQGNGQPNLAQQLMQRAVSNTRYTRQPGTGGAKAGVRPASAVRRIASEDVDTLLPTIPHQLSTDNLNSSNGPDEQDTADDDISRPDSRGTQSDNSSMYLSDSSRTRLKALPPIPTSPINLNHFYFPVAPLQISSSRQSSAVLPASAVNNEPTPSAPTTSSPSPPPSPLRDNPTPILDRARTPPTAMVTRSNSSATTTAANGIHDRGEGTLTDDVDRTIPTACPGISTSQEHLPSQTSFYKNNYTNRSSDLFRGPPPPYYTVIDETLMHHLQTPIATYADQPPNPGPSTITVDTGNNRTSDSISREGSRARRRPPLPVGPRRPQALSSQNFPVSRDRSGSLASTMQPSPQGSIHRAVSVSMSSPKFQVPPPKWRGYTMEAAVWTFTSAQMQAIVSRAIRQSAEASAIRLLGLDVLDNEIPDEMRRLEAQRTDLKTRYKVLTRRRTVLFEALSSYLMGNAEEDTSYSHLLLEDLAEMALTLDRLSEELHSLDGQLAYLDSLTHVHTGSALAVALRKLNASFLKQMTENQTLRSQLRSAEAERDEAWRQADWVARELDEMHENLETPTSNRFRISAHRKSIARSSKTGLTTPSQSHSQRSSMNTAMNSTLSSAKSSLTERVPSVPALKHGKNLDILIQSPLLNSAVSSNSNFDTPSSAIRALNEAQDELYAMLGLSIPERHLRRSRSWNDISIPSPPVPSHHAAQTFLRSTEAPHPRGSRASRRSSLPSDSTLAQVSTAMAVDRNAILFTLDLLSATDKTFA